MSNVTVAKRYAIALFQIAKEQNIVELVGEELKAVKSAYQDNKQLQAVLNHPKVTQQSKKQLVKESFANVSTPVLNTLLILVERHRQAIIPNVAELFVLAANEETGVAEAKVYSARELSEEEKTALANVFAKKIGKIALKIENVIDKSVLGGVKLRIGNRIYDGSVSRKLARVQRELLTKRS